MKNQKTKNNKRGSSLKKYREKRDLEISKEPPAQIHKRKKGDLKFVVQKHAASRLHYDFRIEVDGVLKSWAVPKGPSLDPRDKRLAIMVEDHPYAYKDFEGIIEEGYGKGSVIIWDRGIYSVDGLSAAESEAEIRQGLEKGSLHFFLEGEKLKGSFALVRLKKGKNEWLLIKHKDQFISRKDITAQEESVVSHKRLEQLGGPRILKAAARNIPKAKKKPHFIKPMQATLIDTAFDHEDWIFELKLDGFRAIAELNGAKTEFYSRNFKSFSERFPLIFDELKRLKIDAILDGEVVALDEKGVSRFQLLQNQQPEKQSNLYYFVFDILYLNGKDLRKLPLLERKSLLKAVLKNEGHIQYLDHIEQKGKSFLKAVSRLGSEGIIGKKKESVYQTGARSAQWVKIKAHQQQEAVICGFTEPRRSRKNFGALILGAYKKGKLIYIGHVGGGFNEKSLKSIKQRLTPHIQKECPFEVKPKTNTPVTWVRPKHLCEVRFTEWTDEGIMRHPVFLGLREDKSPKEAVTEKPKKTQKVVMPHKTEQEEELDFLTNLDKIYYPKEKITKGAILGYYAEMGKILLPFLKDRPQSLKRFPNGIKGEEFYQKNLTDAPSFIKTVPFEHKDKTVNYLLIQDMRSLLYAVNLGCIEIHPWLSRYQTPEYPDFFVFDLDPEDISFDSVVETALALHEVLEKMGVPSVCKTTGATGLHICVPLGAKYTYEQAKQFALIVANYVHEKLPNITSLERLPKNRKQKVYIDCFQNNLAQTIAAPYSLRARDGVPVATPLSWKEVKAGIDPLDYTFFNILERIKKNGDLFSPVLGKGIDMKKALKKLENL